MMIDGARYNLPTQGSFLSLLHLFLTALFFFFFSFLFSVLGLGTPKWTEGSGSGWMSVDDGDELGLSVVWGDEGMVFGGFGWELGSGCSVGRVGFGWCLDRDGFDLLGLLVRNRGFRVGLGLGSAGWG